MQSRCWLQFQQGVALRAKLDSTRSKHLVKAVRFELRNVKELGPCRYGHMHSIDRLPIQMLQMSTASLEILNSRIHVLPFIKIARLFTSDPQWQCNLLGCNFQNL